MNLRMRKCPNCCASLSLINIRTAGPFPCPTCKTLLVASEYYPLLTLLGSLTFATVVFASSGFRGSDLVRALLLAFIPVLFLSANFFKYLIPPKIEIYMPDTTLRLH
jgi:hypothetical protein